MFYMSLATLKCMRFRVYIVALCDVLEITKETTFFSFTGAPSLACKAPSDLQKIYLKKRGEEDEMKRKDSKKKENKNRDR